MASKALEEALALHKAGRLQEAEAAYRAIIESEPNSADAYHFLGLVEAGTGRLEAAEASISKAVALESDRPTFHYNLGFVLQGRERFAKALEHYQRSLDLEPNQPAGHYNVGLVLSRLRRFEEASKAFEAAIALQASYAEAWGNLGAARRSLGDNAGAIKACNKALALNQMQAEVLVTLGNAAKDEGDYGAALGHYRAATGINPSLVTAHFNLGNTLIELGQMADGRAALEKAISIDPTDKGAQDNLLMSRLYEPSETERSLYEAHMVASKSLPGAKELARKDDASDRPLKLGFVSADLKRHSCAYFLEPLFEALKQRTVQVFAYSMVIKPDEITERLKSLCDKWTDAIPLGDEELAGEIQKDGIDVLIDLSGHTAGNRLSVFARKPAPVQVSWLGYPATTGLPSIDARLTDALADPKGDADQWHSETLVRLPNSFLLYRAPEDAPTIAPLPAQANGFITFGSFNNLSKINPEVIESWCRILSDTPDSQLMLKGRTMASPGVRDSLRSQFEKRGIGAERLRLIDWLPRSENPLALYNEVDIALDTFPYNGTTTTCEALWMGVPVVGFIGSRHAGRVGASLLTSVRLTDCLASDRATYEQTAIDLAKDTQSLSFIRQSLRDQMATSPLCDGPLFARQFEAALRDLWQKA